MQTACWDLRVEPAPAPATVGGAGGGRGGAGGQGGGGQTGPGGQAGPGGLAAVNPFGAGCATGGGGGFGGGGAAVGPFVLPGTYSVALLIDGKTVDTKPLRVSADPEVALTAAERKMLFDMAMELQALQSRATAAVNAFAPLRARVTELAKEIAGRNDIPAEAKSGFEAFSKEVAAMAPAFSAPAFGRGGQGGFGGQGAGDYVVNKLSQAKNGLMGGMWPTETTMKAYGDAKADVPKAISGLNALLAKAAGVSKTLEAHKLTLKVPDGIK
jgi:hypothetical protein